MQLFIKRMFNFKLIDYLISNDFHFYKKCF